jgi:hypothetical protein
MPNSNPDSKLEFRDLQLAAYYDANYGRSQRSLAAKRDLQRYQFLMQSALPKLAIEDATAIWAAINGCSTTHVEMLPILQQSIAADLRESGRSSLGIKADGWDLLQWIAVVDACDRVGGGTFAIENLGRELKRVGLA